MASDCKIIAFVGNRAPESLQNQCICMVWESGLGGGAREIIPKSIHLYCFGSWLGVGARESFQKQCICMVLEGWWGGPPESLQNQCMCMVLECWLGERRTRLIAKSMHLQSFGRLIRGAENHCKINIFV